MNYIFDFDGTLIDSFPAMLQIFNEKIRPDDDPLAPDEIARLRGMTSRRAVRSLGVRWWQIPKLLLRGLPEFHALIPSLRSFDGLPEVIRTLYDRDDKLYIVTSNTRESVDEFLKLQEMDGLFVEVVAGAGIFKKAKHLRRLIKERQLRRAETVYIGDETRDIQAARMARIKCAAVTWGFNTEIILRKHRPAYLIHKPVELLKLGV